MRKRLKLSRNFSGNVNLNSIMFLCKMKTSVSGLDEATCSLSYKDKTGIDKVFLVDTLK